MGCLLCKCWPEEGVGTRNLQAVHAVSPFDPTSRRPAFPHQQGRRVLSKVTSSSPRVGEPTLEISHTSTEDTSKSEGSSDAGPLLPLGLEALEHSPENFGAVVAECQRLREENRKLQNTLLDFDGQMEALTSECEEILRNTNKRFQAALRSVKYMDTVVQSLREELDNKVRVNTDLELERNLLQRRLGEALNELRLGGGRNHHVAVKSKNEDAGQTRA